MTKNKIKIRSTITVAELTNLFESISKSLNSGVFTIEKNEESICLRPGGAISLKIKASDEKKEQELDLSLSWSKLKKKPETLEVQSKKEAEVVEADEPATEEAPVEPADEPLSTPEEPEVEAVEALEEAAPETETEMEMHPDETGIAPYPEEELIEADEPVFEGVDKQVEPETVAAPVPEKSSEELSETEREQIIEALTEIPGIGPKSANEFVDLGIHSIDQLKNADVQSLWERHLSQTERANKQLKHMLSVAVYYASNTGHDPEKLKWHYWSKLEKEQ